MAVLKKRKAWRHVVTWHDWQVWTIRKMSGIALEDESLTKNQNSSNTKINFIVRLTRFGLWPS